jgi:hypothetical protein
LAKNPNARSRRSGRRSFTLGQALRASKLLNPRWERFRGREVLVFDFEPNPAYKPRDLYDKFTNKLAGAIWIDPQAKQVVRMEQRLLEPYRWAGGLAASLAQGAVLVVEYDFVNNEVWLPVYHDVNMAVRVFLAIGVKVNRSVRNSEFKKFTVESEAEKLKVPQ